MLGTFRKLQALEPSAQEKFNQLEQNAPAGGPQRFYALAGLAKAAFAAGDLTKAESYARELLSVAPEYKKDWNYGNAISVGNMVVGRVALKRDNNVALAQSSLLASGATPGSPQLNSFGPNMSLAKDLLAAHQADTVLQYFALCRKFWRLGETKLDAWVAQVKGGGVPDFEANLLY